GNLLSGASGPAPVADAPGLYALLVTDSLNGCTSTASVTVQQDIAIPQASIAPAPTLTCVLLQTTLQGTIQAGSGIEVLWTTSNGNLVSGANSASPTVDQPGDYLMTVTNTGNGCVNTASLSVLQNIVLPTANAGPDATLSCAVSNLTLQGTATINGVPQFLWTPSAGGNIASGGNTLSPLIDAPGTYTLLVTDQDNGCTATDLVTILNDASAPNAAVATPGTLTCTVTQLNLQGFGSLGGNFTHQWAASAGGNITGGANTLTPAVDEPGVYTLTVTNETNGCTATAQATVNQNITPPVVSIAAPATLSCAVGTVSLSASPSSGGFAYFWDTTNGQLVSGGATPAPVISKPGTYLLRVTSLNNGCTATATVQVAIDTLHPTIAAAPPAVLNCLVKQIQLTGSVSQPGSNFTAAWTSTNGHFVSGQNSLSPTVDAPGTYVLTVKNSLNGCTSTTTALATQNITPPQASAAAPPVLSCAQPQQSLDASGSTGIGALSFAWSGGQILSGATSPNPVVNTAASYSLTVTDAANGCTAAISVLVTENKTPPVVTILPPGLLTCAVSTLPIDAGESSTGPNFAIQWATSNGHFSNGQNTLLPTVDAPGTYVLTLVDQTNGCSQSATVAVAQDLAPPAVDAGPADELHCLHPQTTLQGSSSTTGTLLFQWSTSNGNIASGANQATPTVDAPGQYLLVVTSAANGCSASDLVTITEVPPPAFSATPDQPDCLQPNGAFAFGTVSGGTAPYSYSINNGQSFQASANFSNLAPGDYVLVVRDANGCTDTELQSLFAPAYPTVELPDWHLIAQGDSVQLQPVTTPPALLIADWQWSPAEGLSCADCPEPWAKPLLPVVYSLTITDQNGCTARSEVQLRVDRRRQLYIPNIFSPNGDGENDIFLVFGRGVVEVRNLRVFDRWGNQLFENEHLPVNDPAEGWDGNFRGQAMQPGVYIWQAVVEFIDGQVEVYAGDVTILR
ncbi:MAG: gliding motility-associated C-terminal domain-containing protein, partial [Saprospiraceae bacterium]|nr:gliding motility-associated C-terminal domain-containing protein [Saprospiraceae bacterium]